MSGIIEKLSSLKLTTWLLVILVLWFSGGTLLAASEAFRPGFQEMNSRLVRNWLMAPDRPYPLLKLWFVGLCVIMGAMGINLVFCSWSKLLRITRVRFSGPRFFMLTVHVVFGLVALGHLGGFMLGFKYDKVRLRAEQLFQFEDGYEIEVARVHFVDDCTALRKSRRELTREEFHYRENFAEVILRQNGNRVRKGRLYILSPLKYKDILVTLRKFVNQSRYSGIKKPSPGVLLTISKNPVLNIFLVLYPLMIIGIVLHLLMTWRSGRANKPHWTRAR